MESLLCQHAAYLFIYIFFFYLFHSYFFAELITGRLFQTNSMTRCSVYAIYVHVKSVTFIAGLLGGRSVRNENFPLRFTLKIVRKLFFCEFSVWTWLPHRPTRMQLWIHCWWNAKISKMVLKMQFLQCFVKKTHVFG